jgi:hypothetical protein
MTCEMRLKLAIELVQTDVLSCAVCMREIRFPSISSPETT